MDIAGVVKIQVKSKDLKSVAHEFRVLNTKTYSNVLLSRDFMKRFGTLTFDFEKKRVHLGRVWLNGVRVRNKEKVRRKKCCSCSVRASRFGEMQGSVHGAHQSSWCYGVQATGFALCDLTRGGI